MDKECHGCAECAGAPLTREALWQQRLRREEALGLRHGTENDYHSRRAWLTAKAVTFLLKATGLYARGYRNACTPRLTDVVFSYPGLHEDLDGIRILHLSDLHFRSKDMHFTRAIRDFLRNIETDVCVLTGDYMYGYYGPQEFVVDHMREMLKAIHAPLGVFATLGNHDLSDIVPGLRQLGITMLINEGVALRAGAACLWLGGVDDPHKFCCESLPLALDDAPQDAFKVLLAHTPERIADAAARGVNLYLCGHTHGGQVRFPLIGAILLNARCSRKYSMGRWQYGAMQGYTTPGVGSTDIPVRFLCPAEAARITLCRA